MRDINKKIAIAAVILAVSGTILYLPKSTYAFWPFDGQNQNNQSENQTKSIFPPIIQKIIDKFSLNPDEVKKVVDETRNERRGQMQTKIEEKLAQDVKDGKITEEQKNKILEKQKELQQNMENWQSLTPEQRREKAQSERDNLQKWATDNGIDLKFLMPFGGRFKRFGGGILGKDYRFYY